MFNLHVAVPGGAGIFITTFCPFSFLEKEEMTVTFHAMSSGEIPHSFVVSSKYLITHFAVSCFFDVGKHHEWRFYSVSKPVPV